MVILSNQIPIDSSYIDAIGICEGVYLKISHSGTQNLYKSSFYQSRNATMNSTDLLTRFDQYKRPFYWDINTFTGGIYKAQKFPNFLSCPSL